MPANDALLLIGHGSARYPDAAAALHRHAQTLRAASLPEPTLSDPTPPACPRFAQIEVALLHGTPTVEQALRRITAPTLRVVPFFMEDGYFSRVAIPHALAGRPGTILCSAIGVHDAIAGLIERQALAACDDLAIAPPSSAIILIGHGSASAPNQALALHRHAARVVATGLFARVEPACLEQPPFLAETLSGLRRHPVVVIGCFANHGAHVRDDIPRLIAAEQAARAGALPIVRFTGCVTDDPAMPDIIIDQAFNAVAAKGE
ncbi:CbiX/SirB N-terminal domain-containing protein [Rhodopila sp.]|uniref:CbiX/SirB N-terminal domain-containing protein n=1 Tax=Rhodopila sp. TaxID=2480087 RepID=UPI003D0D85D7